MGIYLPVEINHVPMHGFVASGCPDSIISKGKAEELDLLIVQEPSTNPYGSQYLGYIPNACIHISGLSFTLKKLMVHDGELWDGEEDLQLGSGFLELCAAFMQFGNTPTIGLRDKSGASKTMPFLLKETKTARISVPMRLN